MRVMAQEKEVLGHIDCPACGTPGGMRITHDKNGEPFGFCEANCNQQMRIGGSARRVALFVALHPWAAKPVTVQIPLPEKQAQPVKAENPVREQEKKPRAGFAFGL